MAAISNRAERFFGQEASTAAQAIHSVINEMDDDRSTNVQPSHCFALSAGENSALSQAFSGSINLLSIGNPVSGQL